ncbi:MAG: AEC family transporter [Acetanaerobacterium sp.]
MDFFSMAQMQLMLFLLILAGLYAKKRGIITEQSQRSLSDLLIGVILPCNIIASFDIDLTAKVLYDSAKVLLIAFGAQLLYLAYSKLFFRRIEHGRQMVLRYATIVSNAGFLGLPIVGGIFGSEGMLYASIALIPLRVFMWSSGLSLFTKTDAKSTFKTLITHPCIIAVFIGFAVLLIPYDMPVFLSSAITGIGNCTTAVSMLIIGGILAEIKVKTVVSRTVLYFSFIRLIFIPLSVYAILTLLRVDALLTGVSVVLAAMPAGSTTAILAAKYGGDAQFASKTVFVSTVLSLFTIPLLVVLLF